MARKQANASHAGSRAVGSRVDHPLGAAFRPTFTLCGWCGAWVARYWIGRHR